MAERQQATTRDLGLCIRDFIEGVNLTMFTEKDGELEPGDVGSIWYVDCSDPNNLHVSLDNGQIFTVRIIEGNR